MKPVLFSILLVLIFSSKQMAQFPIFVTNIECVVNQTVFLKGNLNQGAPMDNLSWAWKITVGCFKSIQKNEFSGNHVFYSTTLPPHTSIEIIVKPESRTTNFSVYAYLLDANDFSTVPDLKTCIACEADFKRDDDKLLDNRRRVVLTTNNDANHVIIGVVGAKGLKTGEFTLEISTYDIK